MIAPTLLFVNAALFLGLLIWVIAAHRLRGEVWWWFAAWLGLASLHNLVMGISAVMGPSTASLDLWRGAQALLAVEAVFLLLFARSFGREPGFARLLWSAPAAFCVALMIYFPVGLIQRTGRIYTVSTGNIEWLLFLIIIVFYVLAGIIYLAALYGLLHRSSPGEYERGAALLVLAFLIFMVSFVLSQLSSELGATALSAAHFGTFLTGLLVALALLRFRVTGKVPRTERRGMIQ